MKRRHVIAIAMATCTATVSFAQEPGNPSSVRPTVQADTTKIDTSSPATFGSDTVSYVVDAWAFVPVRTATVEISSNAGSRFVTTPGDRNLAGPAFLPNGAQVIGIELQGCDTNASVGIDVILWSHRTNAPTESFLNHGGVNTGGIFAGGCAYFSANLTPFTIDNFFRSYFIEVVPGAADTTNTFQAVRIHYRLQVSPAPATATFSDVPVGHPFHRFVEALVAAGITGGCAAGNYCPDSPVTRGQMAVFLAVALGLHFPN